MPRYIDADELIFIGLDNPDDDHLFEFVPKEFIDNAPTADVVEVVRCGSCKWLNPKGRCQVFADPYIRPSTSDFCSYGERR